MANDETAVFNITIRFYEELNDFLKKQPLKTDICLTYSHRRSVKDLIESLGVPHVEVDLILVNGESVDFDYIVRNGDRISVYPVFEAMELTGVTRLRAKGLRETRFVLDEHLGALARKLRLLGFDTDYIKNRGDAELAAVSQREGRILLTRDLQLLKRKNISHGLYVRNTNPLVQTVEVLDRLQLWNAIMPFSRCLKCNGLISETTIKPETKNTVPPRVRAWCSEYTQCSQCGQVYWKGSHYDRLSEWLVRLMQKKEEK